MTREEAKKALENLKEHTLNYQSGLALDVAISALSENKGDLVSRQAVDDAIYDYSRSCDVNYAQIMEYIDKIPSVGNKGEWERVGGGSLIDVYKCSKCKHEPPKKIIPDRKTWGWDFTNFCPNCGADMRGET